VSDGKEGGGDNEIGLESWNGWEDVKEMELEAGGVGIRGR
jgi:hypothetical protein